MVAYFGLEGRHVEIDGFDSLAVVNGHSSTAQIPLLHNLHNTSGDGVNGCSSGASLIDTGVEIAR